MLISELAAAGAAAHIPQTEIGWTQRGWPIPDSSRETECWKNRRALGDPVAVRNTAPVAASAAVRRSGAARTQSVAGCGPLDLIP